MIIKKNLQLIVLILFSHSFIYAQQSYFQWVNSATALRERIDMNTLIHSKEDTLGNWVDQGLVQSSLSFSNDQQITLEKINYFNHKNGAKVWFTNNGSQRVFAFSPLENTFRRIDKSTYWGYNFNATQFIRRDTLYSAGGYGFWHYSNVLTYFVETKGEWEMVRTDGTAPKTILWGYQGYDTKKDVFYSGGSEYETQGKNVEKVYDNKLYRFEFNTYSWKELGEINPALPFQTQKEIFWTGKYFLQWAKDKLFIIDPLANEVYVYKDNKQYFQNNAQYFVKDDTIYCYWDRKINTNKFSVSKLVTQSLLIGKFYSPSNRSLYLLLCGGGFIIVLVLSYIFRNKYRLHQNSFTLEEQEKALLKALLKMKEGTYFNTNDLNDLLNLQGKSLENQRKIRTSIIHKLNHKIKQRFKITEAIIRVDDPTDKRLRLYALKPDVLSIIRKEFLN
mgnify:CR=1 FL=1